MIEYKGINVDVIDGVLHIEGAAVTDTARVTEILGKITAEKARIEGELDTINNLIIIADAAIANYQNEVIRQQGILAKHQGDRDAIQTLIDGYQWALDGISN